ncbi:MAG: leucine-rich repeat domain-containing protein [Prevotella sp.]|nr:leucine-rich repeat domain-containing protein [Prevotella sp.]
MKGKVFKSLLAVVCLLCSTNVSAYDFEVDGLYYEIISESDFTCKVARHESGYGLYRDDIVIPATVSYNNMTLTVLEVGQNAFGQCKGLTSVIIPNSVTTIGGWAFEECNNLESVEIPNSINTIGDYAFSQCYRLESIELPNSVTTIGALAFWECHRLTSVTIPNSVTMLGDHAFAGCARLASVTLPNSITTIEYGTFYDCIKLASIEIPNSVTTIGYGAFNLCHSLTNVTIPNSVTTIESAAFGGSRGLTSVTLGNSVSSIDIWAFIDCRALTTLYSLNTTPPNIKFDTFDDRHYNEVDVYVPQEALEAYQSANVWKNFKNLHAISATEIEGIVPTTPNAKEIKRYDAAGHETNSNHKGLTIIKMSDGTTRKMMVK